MPPDNFRRHMPEPYVFFYIQLYRVLDENQLIGQKTVFMILFSPVILNFRITDSIRFNLAWRSARLLSNSCISLYCTAIGLLPLGHNLYNYYIEMLPKNQRVLGSIVVNIKINRGLYVAIYPPHLNHDFTMCWGCETDSRKAKFGLSGSLLPFKLILS